MRILLTVIDGPEIGQSFAFDQHDHFLVGRAKVAHFRRPAQDPYFSRLHFMIEVNPPACRLVDMGSTNGTFVNGKPVQTIDLSHDDVIGAGDTKLRVTIEYEPGEDVAETQVRSSDQHGTIRTTSFVLSGNDPQLSLPTWEDSDEEWRPPGYTIERELGRGGMGVVYLGRNDLDGTQVAIKAIRPNLVGNAAESRRFLREIEILRQLSHPHIVNLQAAGSSEGLLYFVMEYVEGEDLKSWARQRQPKLPVSRAITVMLPVLRALEHAHGHGFVHRDVKPGNVLLGKAEGKLRVKLADFGLARIYQESKLSGLTLTGDICGTPAYMAPEQVTDARKVQPASDQYSAAATLYWLISGVNTHEFGSDMIRSLQKLLLDDAAPIVSRRADVPEPLANILHRALSKEPSQRFASIEEFRLALTPFARE